MDIEYMRTAKKSYMIVKKADFPFEIYELKMILQNEISCLLPFQMIMADGAPEYWYDVSGMQPMKTRFLLESPDGKQLRFLLESLMKMKSDMEEYLLDDSNLCMSSDMVYFDHSGEKIRFCYIPGLGRANAQGTYGGYSSDIKELFEEILQHLNHSDPAAVRMGYEMYERAARAPFVVQDCLDCLRIGESIAAKAPDLSIADRDIRWSNEAPDLSEIRMEFEDEEEMEFLLDEPEQKAGHRKKRSRARGSEKGREKERENRKRHFREQEPEEDELLFALRPDPPGSPGSLGVAEDIGRTEVIFDERMPAKGWELLYRGTGVETDLILSGFPFLVGTDARRVNGVLRARTVSRVHAKLYLEGDRLMVEDFNSTNGTYLNRRLLPMNTPSELKEGDLIVFATEEFEVYAGKTGYH